MKITLGIIISILIILSSSIHAVATTKKSSTSSEKKGMVIGGAATGIGTTIGVTVAGVTALFPAVLIGTGIGYITVKAGKSIKKFRKKNK